MRKGLILLILAICFLFGQVVQAENEQEFDVIKKVSHKQFTYLVVKSNDTDDLFLIKEEREKGKRKEVFRTSLGTFEDKVVASIHVKKESVFLLIVDGSVLSLMKLDDTSGHMEKKYEKLTKKKPKKNKKSSLALNMASSKEIRTLNTLETETLEAPSFFTIEKVTPTTVSLKWNEVDGAEKYHIYEERVFEEDDSKKLIAETDSTVIELDHLNPGDFCFYYLRAVQDDRESDEIYVAVVIPKYFNEIEVESTSNDMSINWSPAEDFSHYELDFYDIEEQIVEVKLEETNYVVEDLEPLSTYVFVLSAKENTTTMDFSIVVSMTYPSEEDAEKVPDFPDPPAPTGDLPAPEDFTVDPIEQTYVTLNWEPVDGAEGYVLWINGNKYKELGNVTTYELKNLTSYTPYELHLRALDDEGRDGESSVQSFYTLPDHLDPPKVKIDKVTSISAYLTWPHVKASRTYLLSYNGKTVELKDENVKIKGLKEEQRYVFTLVAKHGRVESDPVEVEIVTKPFGYEYEYDGSLLEEVWSTYEQQWKYSYDKNGNVTKIIYTPVPPKKKQEFDINNALMEASDEK